MKLTRLVARPILDSRGAWTVEIVACAEAVCVRASVPQGKSTGSHEAVSLPAAQAVTAIHNEIAPALIGYDVTDQEGIDATLRECDGTETLSRLGANSALAVSWVMARLGAHAAHVPLWQYLQQRTELTPGVPRLFMNMINGGVHAGSGLAFQEHMIIPETDDVEAAVTYGVQFYDALHSYLFQKYGPQAVNVGDEGGFAPQLSSYEAPFQIFDTVRTKVSSELSCTYGLDAAATELDMTTDELSAQYAHLIEAYPLAFIEDPFGEDDFSAFAALQRDAKDTTIIGDDLTVTQVARMERAAQQRSIQGVIIKPNQVGTVTDTLAAIQYARQQDWKVIISHRSGETGDDAIADLAYGVGAYGIKLGAPARGERVAKYNRLLAITGGEGAFL